MKCSLLVIFFFVSIHGTESRFGPKKLYSLDLPTNIVSVRVINKQLYFIGSYYIGVIDNVHWKFRAKRRMKPSLINRDIPNPRTIGKIPAGTLRPHNLQHYWVASWGTNDTNGEIYVMRRTSTYSIAQSISLDAGWNYEHTQWVDMDFDGYKDCLTARYRGGVGQMLWFKQPSGQSLWGQKIIHEGLADGNFIGFFYDRKAYILVAGNQFNSLGLYWTMNRRNNWSVSRQVRQRILDNYGRYYDVQYIDLNRDGRKDILTTTVRVENSRGQVLGYEIPRDIQNADWTRRVLAAGFTGDFSPGKATAFWPNKNKRRTDRPSIFLSGGGEGKIFVLSPVPKTRGWGYIKASLDVGTGVLGIPFVGDLDGDFYPEIIVPQNNKVHVYSYDYSASVAEPPRPATTNSREPAARPVVPYRNAYARPTTPPPAPAIPSNQIIQNPSPVTVEPAPALPPARLPQPALPVNVQRPSGPVVNPAVPAPNPANSPLLPGAYVPPRNNPQINQVAPAPAPVNNNQPPNNVPVYQVTPPPPVPPILVNQQGSPPRQATPIPQTQYPPARPTQLDYNGPPRALPPTIPPPPINSLLHVTDRNLTHWGEATFACSTTKRKLCSLQQLQTAQTINDDMPRSAWGWYEDQGRAAKIELCTPGEIKWEGYTCYNGVVGSTAIFDSAAIPALCCGLVNGARYTYQMHRTKSDAAKDCKSSNQHLCTMNEMMSVWEQSSYKGKDWGWYAGDDRIIKMVHNCDASLIPYPGYKCWYSRLETAEIRSQVQQSAFCCDNSSALMVQASLLLSLLCCFSSVFMH